MTHSRNQSLASQTATSEYCGHVDTIDSKHPISDTLWLRAHWHRRDEYSLRGARAAGNCPRRDGYTPARSDFMWYNIRVGETTAEASESFAVEGISVFGREDGVITDVYAQWDTLKMVQELGTVSAEWSPA